MDDKNTDLLKTMFSAIMFGLFFAMTGIVHMLAIHTNKYIGYILFGLFVFCGILMYMSINDFSKVVNNDK